MKTTVPQPQLLQPAPPPSPFTPILRLLLYAAVLLFSILVIGIFSGIAAMLLPKGGPLIDAGFGERTPLSYLLVIQLGVAVAAVLVTLGFVVFLDKRPAWTLGLTANGSWAAEIIAGISIGFLMVGIVFLVSYLAGWSRVTGTFLYLGTGRTITALLLTFFFMIAVGVAEEVIMRGYVFQTLRWGYGYLPALLVSSLLFSILHGSNAGWSFGSLLGTTAAGVLLGYSYVATGRLWMPIAIHFAWNFALGPIFGFPVSGVDFPSLTRQYYAGPAFWTGGRFGPEAGLLTPLVMLLGIVAIRAFTRTIYRPGEQSQEIPSPAGGRGPG